MTREFNSKYKEILLNYIQLGPTTFELICAHAVHHIGDIQEDRHTLHLLNDLIRDGEIELQLGDYEFDEDVVFLFAVDPEKTSDPEETSDFQHSQN